MEELEIALKGYREDVERGIAEALSGVPGNLSESVWHMATGGKRLRSVMALATTEAVGGDRSDALGSAVGIELIHTFTLVHDDIMDRDEERRGRKCVHVKYGTPTAILAGDLLETIGLELMGRDGVYGEGIALVRDICEGQKMDIDFESREISIDEYLRMIELKTAHTFECAARVGAILGGEKKKTVKELASYGMNFGMAFQIGDDMADTFAQGRSSDIELGKKTLPVISGWSFNDALVKGDATMKRYSDKALDSISGLDDSVGKSVLAALAQRYGRVKGFT